MKWSIGITSAPRPTSTLERTVESIRQSGWADVPLLCSVDERAKGAWRNWLDTLDTLLKKQPNADVYAVFQDDVVLCRDLRGYAEATLWPQNQEKVALCSPYCPTVHRGKSRGWNRLKAGWHLCGALTWFITPEGARRMLRDLGHIQARSRIDARVGKWAQDARRSIWYHTPSLAQHIGNRNSALGDNSVNPCRVANDFIGEDATFTSRR